ncbi:unnamed protein product [Trichogramma brassicae]|uniref:Uncharacterized protein n=1 Tax=Trichogramma brassicae TaxID=86971 RepID=A0A6H5IQQ1_9HYME|nr:unnamed protein product [Trichogramma brassicae]
MDCVLVVKQTIFMSKFLLTLFTRVIFATFMNQIRKKMTAVSGYKTKEEKKIYSYIDSRRLVVENENIIIVLDSYVVGICGTQRDREKSNHTRWMRFETSKRARPGPIDLVYLCRELNPWAISFNGSSKCVCVTSSAAAVVKDELIDTWPYGDDDHVFDSVNSCVGTFAFNKSFRASMAIFTMETTAAVRKAEKSSRELFNDSGLLLLFFFLYTKLQCTNKRTTSWRKGDDVQRSIELLDKVLSEYDEHESIESGGGIEGGGGGVGGSSVVVISSGGVGVTAATCTSTAQTTTSAADSNSNSSSTEPSIGLTPDDESPSLEKRRRRVTAENFFFRCWRHQSEDDGYMSMNGRKAKMALVALRPVPDCPESQDQNGTPAQEFPPPPEEAERIISTLLPMVSPGNSTKRSDQKQQQRQQQQQQRQNGGAGSQKQWIAHGLDDPKRSGQAVTTQTTLPKTRHQRPYGWENGVGYTGPNGPNNGGNAEPFHLAEPPSPPSKFASLPLDGKLSFNWAPARQQQQNNSSLSTPQEHQNNTTGGSSNKRRRDSSEDGLEDLRQSSEDGLDEEDEENNDDDEEAEDEREDDDDDDDVEDEDESNRPSPEKERASSVSQQSSYTSSPSSSSHLSEASPTERDHQIE